MYWFKNKIMRYLPHVVSLVLLVAGFGWLLYLDWKVGVAVGLIFWGNEINNQIGKE